RSIDERVGILANPEGSENRRRAAGAAPRRHAAGRDAMLTAMRRMRAWIAAATLALAAGGARAAHAGDWDFAWSGQIDADARDLSSEDADARVQAVNALGRYDASLTKGILLPLLKDDDDEVRRAAAHVLGAGGVTEAVPALITWLGEPDPKMKLAAADALGQLGSPDAVTALVRSLGDADHTVRAKAVTALGAIGERGDHSVVVPLIARLADDKADVKRAAIEKLQAIGDRRAVVALVALFNDSSTEVQKAAVVAVGKLGDPAAIPAVHRLLSAPQPEVRAVAITALGDLAAGDALDDLVDLLGPGSGEQGRRAAVALGQIAKAGDPAVAPVALRALVAATEDPGARPGAIEGLRLTGSAAVPVLVDNLEGRQPGDPRTVVELLAEVGDPRATTALVDELDRGRVAVATTIAALARTGDARALVPVLRLVGTGDPGVRRAAMTALGPLLGHDPRAADALIERLTDDDEELRVMAAEYLGQIRAKRAVPALVAMIAPSQPERLRHAAIDALGAIGDAGAAPGLIGILRDGPPELGSPAADALSMLDGDGLAAQLAPVVDQLRGPARAHAVR
ncbi:MAG TPA: HEAT repeat domain-containing protein, partial [Kofleriaceae bacterium]|nr:HEAT repeat domain-containing protein [Kofleriaceae bacterium]